ncbi:anti-sigma B factor antagonist/stage II sporulation protein AA (anti-sigma F factor antagonist) [Nonomuraea polychroma]|uniref:Anti-sigma B factor antagonist/stage II sporulation protein AA (Anti-sigma F factor antagonist) n=1 Tax=Nonomuraea polychroma TaxID=46176 RepID=A0A438M4L4_9ACTN|nr:anti-sigma B factor antagonist/stage II sporulation protein AA (anti-sigma F factor antagonist) [Nonomuraea polychroma]
MGVLERMPLRIEVAAPDATTVALALGGALDHGSASQLAALTFADGYRRIDVDLSELTFIDSSGLAALVRLQQRAEEARAVVHVVALTPYLRKLLTMTALDPLFSLPPE